MHAFLTLAAVQQVVPDKGSWVGNVGTAGVGAILFFGSRALAKHEMILYGPRFGKWVETKAKGFDWKSLMSFLLGFAGITALLGATGTIGDIVRWLQGLFTGLGSFAVINELGMGFICFFCVYMAMKNRDDSIKDIHWGGVCALAFPLGGGIFLETSTKIANVLIGIMHGVPSA